MIKLKGMEKSKANRIEHWNIALVF